MFDALLVVLDTELASLLKIEVEEEVKMEPQYTRQECFEAMYIQALYWSLGASLVVENRPEFDDYIKKTCGFMLVQDTIEKPATVRKLIKIKIIKWKKLSIDS